jgi:hypothetical protein
MFRVLEFEADGVSSPPRRGENRTEHTYRSGCAPSPSVPVVVVGRHDGVAPSRAHVQYRGAVSHGKASTNCCAVQGRDDEHSRGLLADYLLGKDRS